MVETEIKDENVNGGMNKSDNQNKMTSVKSQTLRKMMDRHAKFLKMTLNMLPSSAAGYDMQRMTILYFAVSGLDVLHRLDMIEHMKEDIISWIYSNLINCDIDEKHRCGFRASSTLKIAGGEAATHVHDYQHIAMTYTALCVLVILGDDLSKINRENIAKSIRSLQLPSGSFKAAAEGGEDDMRFIYCAAAISNILSISNGIDKDKAVEYIQKSITYEGGIAQGPYLEAHGGSTYCAVASLYLMDRLEDGLSSCQRSQLVRWLVNRQRQGLNGRPDKDDDTCYTFWIGGALKLLGASGCVDWNHILEFVLSTHCPETGGFGKWPDTNSDPVHTYLGWAGLSLGIDGCPAMAGVQPHIQPVDPALNITIRAKEHLESIQQQHSFVKEDL